MSKAFSNNHHWKTLACQATGASTAEVVESVQTLWSGYGEIFRATLIDGLPHSLIVKHVAPPTDDHHPRGWQSDFATRRKLKSYQVEANWYLHWSKLCTDQCRVPVCYGADQHGHQSWLLLEDLDAAGYPLRYGNLSASQASECLKWLASFHATFLNTQADNLWPIGSYWHLDTRPDEFSAMEEGPLREYAHQIDAMLNHCQFKTLVHGDAKVANFCFAENSAVAAVDFQYIGGGCGMKDVAYFIGSCFDESQCEKYAQSLLDGYFDNLQNALHSQAKGFAEFALLEEEWRNLYPVAWTDFHRFLLGWMPTHQKIHRYTEKMTEITLQQIQSQR